jgi:uncharacterized membrane protein
MIQSAWIAPAGVCGAGHRKGGVPVPRLYSIKPAVSFRGRRFRGIRGWKGKPAHPPLTDFPIALYVLAAFCDVVSFVAASDAIGDGNASVAHDFFAAGSIAMIAGAVMSLPTALTGFWDWWKGLPRDRSSGPIGVAKHSQVWRTANWHMTVMLTATAIVIIDIVVRLSQSNDDAASAAVMILSVLIAAAVAFGAAYGGALVYEYGFNVESVEGSTVWDETEEDVLPGRRPRSTG